MKSARSTVYLVVDRCCCCGSRLKMPKSTFFKRIRIFLWQGVYVWLCMKNRLSLAPNNRPNDQPSSQEVS
jgi:hypothetical protein